MSTYYKEKNSESAKELFWKRTVYNAELSSHRDTYANLVDFNQGEKFLYGRVDRNFVPFLVGTRDGIKAFHKTTQGGSQSGIFALNFVVDAFNDLALQFEKCALTNIIDPSDKYLSTLTVHKAYQDPQIMYQKYKNAYFVGIASMFRKSKIKIRNFEEFIFQLMKSRRVSTISMKRLQKRFLKILSILMHLSNMSLKM